MSKLQDIIKNELTLLNLPEEHNINISKRIDKMDQHPQAFWSLPAAELLARLKATPQGLTGNEARKRLALYGSNLLTPRKRSDSLALFLTQFKSPITLILLFAAGLSFFLHEHVDVLIILAIVFISGLLGFWQERGAANAIEKLLAIVQIKAAVLRDGSPIEIPVEEIVPGDVVILNGGDIIPGDCLILESKDLFVDEATLTGETYPVEKSAGVLAKETQLSKRNNALFMGTHVVSGNAKAVVVYTGKETEFGKISERLKMQPPETEFEHGVRHFGYFLMEITIFACDRHLRHQCLSGTPGPGIPSFFPGSGCRADPATTACDYQHEPCARRKANGAAKSDR